MLGPFVDSKITEVMDEPVMSELVTVGLWKKKKGEKKPRIRTLLLLALSSGSKRVVCLVCSSLVVSNSLYERFNVAFHRRNTKIYSRNINLDDPLFVCPVLHFAGRISDPLCQFFAFSYTTSFGDRHETFRTQESGKRPSYSRHHPRSCKTSRRVDFTAQHGLE